MITGAHSIIYSTNPDADRVFLRDVLTLPNVDVGGGWLIFGLPPAEVAVHPSDTNGRHELYLMCDEVEAFVAEMTRRNVVCGPVQDQGWGLLTQLTLPGGGTVGVYQPRHPRPKAVQPGIAAKQSAAKGPAARKAAARKPAARKAKKPATRATKKRTNVSAKTKSKPKARRR
jgi:hypothetical protein